MEYKSDIEILKEFAKSTHRSIEMQEFAYPRTGLRTTQKFKRMVYVPNNPSKTSFFVWFNDAYSVIGQQKIFSGAFIPLPSKTASSVNIRNRFILDKLNPFSNARKNQIGSHSFDSKAVILGDVDTAVKRLLSRAEIQKQILKALEIESYYHVSINPYNIDFVPELKGQATFSILYPHGWIMEKNNIELMFGLIEKIRELII